MECSTWCRSISLYSRTILEMSGQIITVNPNLPIPTGTNSNDPSNPKATIKSLTMTGNQANADASHDPPPRREGFQSQSNYNYILYILLTCILLFFVFRKHPRYGAVFLITILLLTYVERNLKRTV